jgi:malonyl-ACP decarboxylase
MWPAAALCGGFEPPAMRELRGAPLPLRVSVATVAQAWAQARLDEVDSDRIGVVVAGNNLTGSYVQDQYARFLNHSRIPAMLALHMYDTDHVGTLSEIFGVTGEGCTVGGASASGNVAIVTGARLVETGAVDACLVVGAMTELGPMEWSAFASLGAVAGSRRADPASAACRPFDRAREGFAPGQGSACLVLERAETARRRGIAALAGLAGYAIVLDGNRLANPNPHGQMRAMRAALASAGIGPEQVDYINAHATASELGDEVETRALVEVFGGRPWINSTKGLIGHCLSAAGVVEAVATVLQIRGGFVHPNALLTDPVDPGARFAGAEAAPACLRVAVSNSFGFGGFNTSVVLVSADQP